ncbi:MAG TPA: phenylacetate-CoA oxygenase subunit PaaJ [Bacteroidia bacterium]|nr:phenylacetate-CoA oxygenase subunit PaaJ [Bacteroidia bacterium]HNU33041.1 phenylacetate-CoA oxygenase subunit PaaJ [Bacteroidia bacterium]
MNSETLNSDKIAELLSQIPDPEIPAINIAELGVLRGVEEKDGMIIITITPTYSGCPALHAIEDEIRRTLLEKNINNFKIVTSLFPAWSTDWMTPDTRKKLSDYGIAPPEKKQKTENTICPFCKSDNTKLTSWFGSTACKALHYCNNCHQPFEEFKCI